MQSELCNANGFIATDNGTNESINLILEGSKRDLKLGQVAMIKHSVIVEHDQVYLASDIDVFARGRKLVIGFFVVFLLATLIAIFNSTESWPEQVKLLKTMAMVIIAFIPIAYAYLVIEKWVQHHRLHQKVDSKLKELMIAQPMVQDLLGENKSDNKGSL